MTTIPLIDISDTDTPAAEAATAARLVDAAADHGFVYLRCLGDNGRDIVGTAAIEQAFEASRALFDSPLEEKLRCKIQRNNFGWAGPGSETLDPQSQRTADFKEAFNFDEFPSNKPRQPLPSNLLPRHLNAVASFRRACHALCLKILYLLGLGLEVAWKRAYSYLPQPQLDPPDLFSSAHNPEKGPSGTILRFLRYPPLADSRGASETDVRAGAHSDYGSVTLLFRLKGQPGLQILTRPPESAWAPVPVHPPGTDPETSQPPILVNIGDLLSYWTDGLFRSTVHRVMFPSSHNASIGSKNENKNENERTTAAETDLGPRYSIAFFCHPADDTPLNPVTSARMRRQWLSTASDVRTAAEEDNNPRSRSKAMTAKEHLMMRLAESYQSLYSDKKVDAFANEG